MYGLVNKALEEFVCSRFGEDTWETIKQNAGVAIDVFVSMETYPDDVTYKLVGAASEELGQSTEEILNAFGEYWVLYTAKEGYGEMMSMAGNTIQEFLLNLDDMHARVGLLFPRLKPPSFWCTDLSDHSLRLHYRAGVDSRTGLAPFVIGLVNGLATKFGTRVEMTQTASRNEGADHDEFLVSFKGS